MEKNKYCIIGDTRLRIVSISTEPNGLIKILARPTVSVSKKDDDDCIYQSKIRVDTNAQISDRLWEAMEMFIEKRKEQFPNFQVVKNATPDAAVGAVWRLLKKGYTEDVIIECIKIGINHDFWKRNLMTLTQLNKKCRDELTKFEHLL